MFYALERCCPLLMGSVSLLNRQPYSGFNCGGDNFRDSGTGYEGCAHPCLCRGDLCRRLIRRRSSRVGSTEPECREIVPVPRGRGHGSPSAAATERGPEPGAGSHEKRRNRRRELDFILPPGRGIESRSCESDTCHLG